MTLEAEKKDARGILGTLNRKVTTYTRHIGGLEATEEIIPLVVIQQIRLL
jgi:hypothetical protein